VLLVSARLYHGAGGFVKRILEKILVLIFVLFSQITFAYTCTELVQHCNGVLQWYANIIAEQTAKGVSPDKIWTMPDIQCTLVTPPGEPLTSRAKYIEDDPIGWCSGEPLRCTYPQIKVGTEENGDDKCACPPNAPLSGQLNSSQCEMDLRDKHHIEGLCGGPPPGMAQGNMVEICVSDNNGRGGCLEGYKKHPEATAPGIGDFCIPDIPPVQCPEGKEPDLTKDPSDPSYCIPKTFTPNCPEGTEPSAGLELEDGLKFFGTFPNPRFPKKTGYCNENHCCMGDNPNPLPTGKSYCAQGSAVGFGDGQGGYFTDDTKDSCTCPANAVHESQGTHQQALQTWSSASFFNKNDSLSPLVCDYSKPPADGSGMSTDPTLDTESVFDGKWDACVEYFDNQKKYDFCLAMDGSMRDWIDNNVSCGTKKGLDCISDKMKDVMKHCHVVDGVVTCDQKWSPPEGVQLPEPVIRNSDSHGFPRHQIDEYMEKQGMFEGPNGYIPEFAKKRPPVSNNPNDMKPPEKKTTQKPAGQSGSSNLSTPKDAKFGEVWDSKLLTEQRAKYGKMLDDIMKVTDKFKLPTIGGKLPCYPLDFTKYLVGQTEAKKVCLYEKPYVNILDMLALVIGFLTYLLPVVIFMRN
jgi:hypothetical protein